GLRDRQRSLGGEQRERMRIVIHHDGSCLRSRERRITNLAVAGDEDRSPFRRHSKTKRIRVIRASCFVRDRKARGQEIRGWIHSQLERSRRALLAELDWKLTDQRGLVLYVNISMTHRKRSLDPIDHERHLDLESTSPITARNVETTGCWEKHVFCS